LQERGLKPVTLFNPGRLTIGNGCWAQWIAWLEQIRVRKLFLVSATSLKNGMQPVILALEKAGITPVLSDPVDTEPDFHTVEKAVAAARKGGIDCVAGIGGGSVLDVAKLVAALYAPDQRLQDVVGIGKLNPRAMPLICLPTTSGTGSEVSPNAIIVDPSDQQKKGVISPYLVPDAAFVDPVLTYSCPPGVTAGTGMDALTHCVEAYTNRFAHPVVDPVALEGVRLIGQNLEKAVENGKDGDARAGMALGSVYGGMCLGPVNTAAVHALAYPLGGSFHVAHGLSNAVLLPHVMAFNLEAAPERYAGIAVALGARPAENDVETAKRGVERVLEISRHIGIPCGLSELGISEAALDGIVASAMTVVRLLKNNPRVVTGEDARQIYQNAWRF
jgi:alcohol dehydrogenase class IV